MPFGKWSKNMPENGNNTPRKIGLAIFLGLLFLGISAIAPYLFGLVVSTAPDVPQQKLAAQIGAPPTDAQKVPPQVALQEIRDRDARLEQAYAWEDRENRKVRVPLDRAKRFVEENGLPSR